MPPSSGPNRNLLILFSVIVLDLIGFGVVMPILPFYAKQYGANATVLGLLLTSYSAMQFAFSSVWGRLSDRIGRKNVLLFTIAGSAVSLTILGLADSLFLLFVGRILSGVFAANISVASAYVTDVTTEENRSKGMGMIGVAFGIGFLLGPAMGGILSRHGYHAPILTAAGLCALNWIYTFARLPEPSKHHKPEEVIKTSALSHRPIFMFCTIYFLFTVAVSQLETTFALFMMQRFHYDAMHVAYILALMALIMGHPRWTHPNADTEIRGISSLGVGGPSADSIFRLCAMEPDRRASPPAVGFLIGGTQHQSALADEPRFEKIAAAHAGSRDGHLSGQRQPRPCGGARHCGHAL